MSKSFVSMILLLFVSANLRGQERLPRILVKEVAETLSFLSSDALAGRDTPSPGLNEAAAYIRKRFEEAGLKPAAKNGTFFDHYQRNGQRISSSGSRLTFVVAGKITKAQFGRDFRIYRAPQSGYVDKKMIQPARMKLADAARKGLWAGRFIPKPLLIETPLDSGLWESCAGDLLKLKPSPSKRASAPILLVRPGLLPAGKCLVLVNTPPAAKSPIKLKNVVGLLPGTDKRGEYILVSAHYDHLGIGIPRGRTSDTIYNGADDDASGTTAVIELSELFASLGVQQRPRRSILFVCFSGEEKGLLGSKAMAAAPPVPLASIVANINIEMIGRPAKGKRKCAWITGESRSDFSDIAGPALRRAGIKLVKFSMAEQLYYQSDNYSFATRGVVAHSISAGSIHKDYHRPTDEFKNIDLKHMTAIVNGLAEVVGEFARRQERPRMTK